MTDSIAGLLRDVEAACPCHGVLTRHCSSAGEYPKQPCGCTRYLHQEKVDCRWSGHAAARALAVGAQVVMQERVTKYLSIRAKHHEEQREQAHENNDISKAGLHLMANGVLLDMKAHIHALQPVFGKLCSALKRRDAAVRLDTMRKIAGKYLIGHGRMNLDIDDARRAYEEASNDKVEEERYGCPVHGLQDGTDCPRC